MGELNDAMEREVHWRIFQEIQITRTTMENMNESLKKIIKLLEEWLD